MNLCSVVYLAVSALWLFGAVHGTLVRQNHTDKGQTELSGEIFGDSERSVPYQLSLQDFSKGKVLHQCGAVLIDERTALTAANCFDRKYINPVKWRLVAGTRKLDETDPTQQILPVQKITRHCRWSDRQPLRGNDIALVVVNGSFVFNENVSSIWISSPQDPVLSGVTGTLTGWGKTTNFGEPSNNLKTIKMPLISHEECKAKYDWVKDSMVCSQNSTASSCAGAAGGPLVLRNYQFPDGSTRDLLVGIASFGPSECEDLTRINGFTKISSYYNWINSRWTRNTTTTGRNKFVCFNGQEIDEDWRCDDEFDCKDGSDEKGCSNKQISGQNRTNSTTQGNTHCWRFFGKARQGCGWSGITAQECDGIGCCYGARFHRHHKCFIPSFGNVTLSLKCEFSKPFLRQACGHSGITQSQCEERDCCFDSRMGGSNNCFLKNVNNVPITTTTNVGPTRSTILTLPPACVTTPPLTARPTSPTNPDARSLVAKARGTLFKQYYTTYGHPCVGECAFKGTSYSWCYYRNEGDITGLEWNYCSVIAGTDYKGNRCKSDSPCGNQHPDSTTVYKYNWCYLETGGWGYCSPTVLDSIKYFQYQGPECISPCSEFGERDTKDFIYTCFNAAFTVDQCSRFSGLAVNLDVCTSACDYYGGHPENYGAYSYTWCLTELEGSTSWYNYCSNSQNWFESEDYTSVSVRSLGQSQRWSLAAPTPADGVVFREVTVELGNWIVRITFTYREWAFNQRLSNSEKEIASDCVSEWVRRGYPGKPSRSTTIVKCSKKKGKQNQTNKEFRLDHQKEVQCGKWIYAIQTGKTVSAQVMFPSSMVDGSSTSVSIQQLVADALLHSLQTYMGVEITMETIKKR